MSKIGTKGTKLFQNLG